jgi:short-subunit dehydrogenase
MDLTNRVVWITGASSGIGEAIANELANQGCKLILSARREVELNRVKNNLKISSENIFVLPIDLEQHQNASHWTSQVIDKFGRIDILINNGGISQKSLALETKEAIERKIMDINYFGNVALTKAVLPNMLHQKSGKIVIITSIVGKFGLPELTTYAASKHALYGFYESLRLELVNDNIKMLIAAPGFINTNVAINAIKGDGNLVNENSDAQRFGMKPNVFARKLVKAIKSNKKHIYIGKKELLSIPFKTILPNLFYSIMLKMSNKKK